MTRRAGTVTLSDVGKRFVKYEDAPTLVEGLAKLAKRHRRSRLWAVRHVDLDVAPGESVGVIGRNGSGKTTLLTMLAGVTAPTEGTVRVRGRLAPLLGLGVGFDPELTGRENVYINGSILGMTRREIDRNFDEIVAFAEIPKFIDTPVKFYSSGMNVRLGFAVAISSQPDLLLVDEVLAVGDVGFQQKSFNRMREMQEEGTTILVVSHNATAIRVLAQRVLVLHDGAAHFLGPTREAIDTYFQLMKVTREAPVSAEHAADAPARVESLQIFNESGTPSLSIEHDETVTVRMRVRFERAVDEPVVLFTIRDETDVLLYAERSRELRDHDVRAGDEVTALLRFPMRLAGGTYRLRGAVAWAHGASSTDWSDEVSFFVSTRPFVRGLVDLKPVFEFETRARGTGAPQ